MLVVIMRYGECQPSNNTADASEIRHQLGLVDVGSLSHYLQGCFHPNWSRINKKPDR